MRYGGRRTDAMDLRKLKTLIELVESSGIAELEIEEGEERVRITRAVAPAPTSTGRGAGGAARRPRPRCAAPAPAGRPPRSNRKGTR